jgi:hypothetical protein
MTMQLDAARDASMSTSFRHCEDSSVASALGTRVISLSNWPDRSAPASKPKREGKKEEEPRHGPQTPRDGFAPLGLGSSA